MTTRPADTWDYTAAVLAAIDGTRSMLDMGTGGGERLAALPTLTADTWATEGYPPNVAVARRRLGPRGVTLVEAADDGPLPFADGRFDLVTNRHGAYTPGEVWRVLRPGGRFITQQVGWQANRRLHELLGDAPAAAPWNPASARGQGWELTTAVADLEAAGFRVEEGREEFPVTRYHDVGAIIYYLKAIPWEIPDFSVERYLDRLAEIHAVIQAEGPVEVPFHQFFIRARRP